MTNLAGQGAQNLTSSARPVVDDASSVAVRDQPLKPTASRWAIFGTVSIGLFMIAIDGTIVATALPVLHRSLHTTLDWTGWSITAYLLGQTMVQPIAGRFSDLMGRKHLLMISIAVFTASSLACGLAPNIAVLIIMRFIQALGGGAVLPSATGIVVDTFGSGRDRAIGMFSAIFPLGMLTGPIVGAFVIDISSWREIFFINVPIGIILLVLAALCAIPRTERKGGDRPDLVGTIQIGTMILAAMLAIASIGTAGTKVTSPVFIGPLALAFVVGYFFVRRARRVKTPAIPLSLLFGKGFLLLNIINLSWGISSFGVSTLVPVYAEDRYHLSEFQAGSLLTARGIGMLVISIVAAMGLRRFGYRIPVLLSVVFLSGGLVLLALRPAWGGPYEWLAFGAAIMGFGVGVGAPALSNSMLALAPEQAAAISGLRSMFRQAGGILSISLITAAVTRSATVGASRAVTGAQQGAAFSHAYIVLAFAYVLVLPCIFRIPSLRRSW